MKLKPLFFAIIVSVGFIVLVVTNHHTENKIEEFAKRDLIKSEEGFTSLISFCGDLSRERSADVSFYYRSGWDVLGVKLVDTLGNETRLKLPPPQFLSQLYFNTVDIAARYEFRQKKLVFTYPYYTWRNKSARLIYQDTLSTPILPAEDDSKSLHRVGSSWYLEFYDPSK